MLSATEDQTIHCQKIESYLPGYLTKQGHFAFESQKQYRAGSILGFNLTKPEILWVNKKNDFQ